MSATLLDWNGAQLPNTATTEGKYVRLEKLDPETHGDDLWLAYCGPNCDPAQFDGLKYGPFSTRESFDAWLTEISSSLRHHCYATINLHNSKAEGFNCYVSINADNGSIEVGFHYGQCMQRTTRSTEATFLLINKAFLLGYRRVEARTSANNVASIKNLERMGFQQEATCRQKQIMKGAAVDTAFYSILRTEWLPIQDACNEWLSDDNQRDGVQKKSLTVELNICRDSYLMVLRILTTLKNREKSADAFVSTFQR